MYIKFIKERLFLIGFIVVGIILVVSGIYAFIPRKSIKINKLVSNPVTSVMVDNLEMKDPKYSPSSIVKFQIRLTNNSNSTIPQVSIKDVFPNYVDFDKGAGKFDPKTKTLTFDVKNLKPNEAKVFNFSGRVSDDLPSLNTLCVIGRANVTIDRKVEAMDNSQLCIEKKVATTATTEGTTVKTPVNLASSPATGPAFLTFFLLIPAGIMGWSLRRYNKI